MTVETSDGTWLVPPHRAVWIPAAAKHQNRMAGTVRMRTLYIRADATAGLPAVCTPLKSIHSYFKKEPMIRFSEFDGEDFGRKIISWLDEKPLSWQIEAAKSAARVQMELDWQPLCRKAVDFIENIYARGSHEKDGLAKNH